MKRKLKIEAKRNHRTTSGQAILFIEEGVKHQESERANRAVNKAASSRTAGVKHPTRFKRAGTTEPLSDASGVKHPK